MTSELRPAVEVWNDAYEASYYDEVDDDRAAAAVIEADREAARAEVVGEIVAWLRDQDRGVGWLDYDTAQRIEAKFGESHD